MNSLNVRKVLFATAVGAICVPLVGLAAPCPPGEEKEQKVAATVAYVQEKGTYNVVVPEKVTVNTVVLKADKDGKLVEVKVRPVDGTKNEYVIWADSISISDVAGKKKGDFVVTMAGDVAFEVAVAEKAPSVQIGVVTEALSKALAGHLKIQPSEALIVTGVIEGLPAAKAGIKEYDVITRVDGDDAVTHVRLKEILSRCKPEQIIALRVLREGEPREVKVRVEAIEPKVQPLTTTYQNWSDNRTNLKAELSFAQPRLGSVVTQVAPGRYLALTEPLRTQKFVTIDPKISTQILKVKPFLDVQRRYLTLRNFEFTDTSDQIATVAVGESLEARLLAEITTLQQQLAKLKDLIVQLEATSNNEDE